LLKAFGHWDIAGGIDKLHSFKCSIKWQELVNFLSRSQELSKPWSYGSWIYNYLCNQCLSPLMLWVLISIRARYTILCDKVCQWLATGWWFSPGPPVSSTNKTYRQNITEILLKVALNIIKHQTNVHGHIHQHPLWVKCTIRW
jgi:hypothetical protein